jgi:hypothetical protein
MVLDHYINTLRFSSNVKFFPRKHDEHCDSPIDATVWCLFSQAFFLMLRKSNLVPDTVATFYSKTQLCRKNFTFEKRKFQFLTCT